MSTVWLCLFCCKNYVCGCLCNYDGLRYQYSHWICKPTYTSPLVRIQIEIFQSMLFRLPTQILSFPKWIQSLCHFIKQRTVLDAHALGHTCPPVSQVQWKNVISIAWYLSLYTDVTQKKTQKTCFGIRQITFFVPRKIVTFANTILCPNGWFVSQIPH